MSPKFAMDESRELFKEEKRKELIHKFKKFTKNALSADLGKRNELREAGDDVDRGTKKMDT